jgi:hypothetical protein
MLLGEPLVLLCVRLVLICIQSTQDALDVEVSSACVKCCEVLLKLVWFSLILVFHTAFSRAVLKHSSP